MAKSKEDLGPIHIEPPRMRTVTFRVTGTTPYVQLRFTKKAYEKMRSNMEAGPKAKVEKSRRSPRDFDNDFEECYHRFADGKPGIPATAFKASMVRAATLCGLEMVSTKLLFFVEADGFDVDSGDGLIRFEKGKMSRLESVMPNANGHADIRVRAKWDSWSVMVRVTFDETRIDSTNLLSLLLRAGLQVGIGEGRQGSKKGTGMGWGFFKTEVAKLG